MQTAVQCPSALTGMVMAAAPWLLPCLGEAFAALGASCTPATWVAGGLKRRRKGFSGS